MFSGQPDHRSNEFGHASWYRDCSAVGGACFSISRQAWDAIGGLSHPARYPRLDVQIALDVKPRAGLRVVYNPYARLYQNGPAALEPSTVQRDQKMTTAGIQVELAWCHVGALGRRRRLGRFLCRSAQ